MAEELSPSPLTERLKTSLGDALTKVEVALDQVTIEVPAAGALDVFTRLRDALAFEQLMDLCGVDYLSYGKDEWATSDTQTYRGYSRAVEPRSHGRSKGVIRQPQSADSKQRFAVVYHLLSISHNERLRVRIYAPDDELPVVASVTDIWASANWFEREAFDLFGIVFEGHPDLRRILTDYGFVGHPFRKDFPLIGQVEMRYDPVKGRVVYEPVSIEPRVTVPRVIRRDHRYLEAELAREAAAAQEKAANA
ncbi:MAG: NADH-quinone oxidoreductase subunit C [Candidatus Competibacterales bacterium]